jgi:hypothetical protein
MTRNITQSATQGTELVEGLDLKTAFYIEALTLRNALLERPLNS